MSVIVLVLNENRYSHVINHSVSVLFSLFAMIV
jgi:hypothetical protein